MDKSLSYAAALSAAGLLYVLTGLVKNNGRNPPGPKPLPLVGNMLDFPQDKPWEVFAKWQEQYGDIIYMSVLGTPMVILNSFGACNDLLDKRSAKYSGRPQSVMLGELTGFNYIIDLMGYTPRWRKHRRLFHQYFNETESAKYRPVQERYVHLFLQRLLDKPDDFLSHIRLLFGETILDIVYGIKKHDDSSVFVRIAENAMVAFQEAGIPGQFLVDVIPPLRHIPSWFPGANFQRLAAEWRKVANDVKDLPFAYAKKKMENGTAEPSVVMSMLEQYDETFDGEQVNDKETSEDVAKNCAAVAYLGGADTTLSTIQTVFMVMANYQDVQKEAQNELDALLSSPYHPLPNYEDQESLPFVTAITKELLRWHNVVPLSVAHELTEDDEYNGYFLRKGTIVYPNIWHVLRDPAIYPDPFTFNPRRWLIDTPDGWKLNPNVPDPTLTFGSGRRICPGRYFALNSLFVIVANLLACFNIQPLDAQGKPTERVDEVFTSGLLIYPVPFRVSITPRSDDVAHLIRDHEYSP